MEDIEYPQIEDEVCRDIDKKLDGVSGGTIENVEKIENCFGTIGDEGRGDEGRGDEGECDKNGLLLSNKADWIESFKNNNNTGTAYEISVGSEMLELPFVKGVYNLSQKDNVRGTGDIGILFSDGNIKYYSITQKKGKGQINKCLRNSSGSLYGLKKNDETEKKNTEAYDKAKSYREREKGETPNSKWKRNPKCPGTKFMCEWLAEQAVAGWNNKSASQKRADLLKILDLNSNCKPNCDGIIYWDNKNNTIHKVFDWSLKLDLTNYLDCYSDGIYIYHGSKGDSIIKTQVKYNNGIIEGMSSRLEPSKWKIRKSSQYLSSWNCIAHDLTKIFNLKEITHVILRK